MPTATSPPVGQRQNTCAILTRAMHEEPSPDDDSRPTRMEQAELDALRLELDRKADLLIAHVLVYYIHEGHPYDLAVRSPNALPWIQQGQDVIAVRLDDATEFWRIRDRLARERGL